MFFKTPKSKQKKFLLPFFIGFLIFFYFSAQLSIIPPRKQRFLTSCKKWAVLTTIFNPGRVAQDLSKLNEEWCTVVVGDVKSPDKAKWKPLVSNRFIYIDVADAEKLPYKSMKWIPQNHFGRKNIGYLIAIHHGAEIIFDVDDDNYFNK